jgi:hypothetical protein
MVMFKLHLLWMGHLLEAKTGEDSPKRLQVLWNCRCISYPCANPVTAQVSGSRVQGFRVIM